MNLSILFTLVVAAFFSYAAPASSAEPVVIEGQKNTLPWFKCTDESSALSLARIIGERGADASLDKWKELVIARKCSSPAADHEMMVVELVYSVTNKTSPRVYSVLHLKDVAGQDFWAITGNAVIPKP